MTDFGEFFDNAEADAKRAGLEREAQKIKERDDRMAARKAQLEPLYRVALPVFERAKAQLAAKDVSVIWRDDAETTSSEAPVIDFWVKRGNNTPGTASLNVSGTMAVLRYRKAGDPGDRGASIGNVALEDFGPADAERIVKRCVEGFFPKL